MTEDLNMSEKEKDWVFKHASVSGQEKYCWTLTVSLFTWSCFLWYISFLQHQGDLQVDPFWKQRVAKSRNVGAEGYPRRILPVVHISVEYRRLEKWIRLELDYFEGGHVVYSLE